MKKFEEITNWEFHNKGKFIQKFTSEQIKTICDMTDGSLNCRVGGMWSGTYAHPEMGHLCPGYPKAKLVVYKKGSAVLVQVYHTNIWSGRLGISPKYDKIVAEFVKFLDS